MCTNNVGAPPTCGPCTNGFIGNNFCSGKIATFVSNVTHTIIVKGTHSAKSAGMIAGITIGGFLVVSLFSAYIEFFFDDGSCWR